MLKAILLAILAIMFYIRFEDHVHKTMFIIGEIVRRIIKAILIGGDDSVIFDIAALF